MNKKSQYKMVWRRLKKNKSAMAGLAILIVILCLALFADVITNYKEMAIKQHPEIRMQPPSRKHWFGTDAFGRDMFARTIHGARVSMKIGIVTTGIAMFIGCILGASAAYYGGKTDNIIMRVLDVVSCIPGILLALTIVASLGPSLFNLMVAITIAITPSFVRVVRSVVLPITQMEFIEAAKACGTSDARIIVKHILPNAIGPILVQATMYSASLIMTAASLSYIGMGVQPPNPEWGAMLAESKDCMRYSPYLVIVPGMSIVITSISLNLLGDGLRDALDPRLKN